MSSPQFTHVVLCNYNLPETNGIHVNSRFVSTATPYYNFTTFSVHFKQNKLTVQAATVPLWCVTCCWRRLATFWPDMLFSFVIFCITHVEKLFWKTD